MKRWIAIIIILIGCWYSYNQFQEYTTHKSQLAFWSECHPFIDLIESNINGLRPDPGGTITITTAPSNETVYVVGSTWAHDHCFDPNVCGTYQFNYSGEYEDCENCTAIGGNDVHLPCEGGGGDGCCEKYLVEISAPYELECGECVEICAITNNYMNPDYEWSTGETTQCIEVCMAGEFSVIVMEEIDEDCMCMHAAVEKIVIKDTDLSCSLNNVEICEGGFGQFDLSVVGENPPFTISWSGTNGFTSSLEDPIVDDVGFYTVEIQDDEGCIISCSANLFVKPTPPPIVKCPI